MAQEIVLIINVVGVAAACRVRILMALAAVRQPFHGCGGWQVEARPTEELRAGRSFHCGVIDEGTRSTREVLKMPYTSIYQLFPPPYESYSQ